MSLINSTAGSENKILVTGAAGFIGFHVARTLLERGDAVFGVDNLNPYYDPDLKQARLDQLTGHKNFQFEKLDLSDADPTREFFDRIRPERVIHLAAQPGVRYSLQNPKAYVDANLLGFANILEGCRATNTAHLTYASSSSVYGSNTTMPFQTRHNVDHPISLYAASKKANELMAHVYSHLYRIPTTGLRFFTVYGPWGRPDMAVFAFTKSILEGKTIEVFNNGQMRRDFTYIDDVVKGVVRIHDHPAQPDPGWNSIDPDPATSNAPYRLYNIGNNQPVELMKLVELIENAVGRKAKVKMMPIQPGDVRKTWADIDGLAKDFDYQPTTSIEEGMCHFVNWYLKYYGKEPQTSLSNEKTG